MMKQAARSFLNDDRGAIVQLFALSLVVVIGCVGLAIDGGRAMSARNKAAAALDSAALAATRTLVSTGASDTELTRLAEEYFRANTEQGTGLIATFDNIRVNVDRMSKTIRVTATTSVPTFFAQVVGFDMFRFDTSATASFLLRDIELGVQLDLTGSMCDPLPQPCTSAPKLDALKAATRNLIDDLMPDSRMNVVRIGLAPFSVAVDAGAYVNAVTEGTGVDCVLERRGGSDATTDASPIVSPLIAAGAGVGCPRGSSVVPISDDKDFLKAQLDGFVARGGTAGHLGTGWAWYLVSPNWAGIWPAGSTPTDYGTANVLKATVLMTDGKYNQYGGGGDRTGRSYRDARRLCENMKRGEKIVVYTVIFMEDDPTAVDVLRNCATEVNGERYFYQADNEAELNNAFRDIAFKLNNLRLAN